MRFGSIECGGGEEGHGVWWWKRVDGFGWGEDPRGPSPAAQDDTPSEEGGKGKGKCNSKCKCKCNGNGNSNSKGKGNSNSKSKSKSKCGDSSPSASLRVRMTAVVGLG
jgi:hypothetical protein